MDAQPDLLPGPQQATRPQALRSAWPHPHGRQPLTQAGLQLTVRLTPQPLVAGACMLQIVSCESGIPPTRHSCV